MNLSMKFLTVVAIGVALFLAEGCKKDINPCETPKEGENYLLSDSAKTYINHYADANRIIFKTLSGADIAFEVVSKETIGAYQVPFPCEVDPAQSQTVIGTSQLLSFSLSNSAVLTDPIFVNLVEYPIIPSRDAYETLAVSLGELFTNSFEDKDGLFNYYISGNNPQINFLDSLVIGGKTFYSVYEMNDGQIVPNLEIKYSINQGIIYIKNPQNSMEYVYDRKE
ncbi:MAG: hypothetical protein ACKV1O_21580 [Saprospiraceae bacterium]